MNCFHVTKTDWINDWPFGTESTHSKVQIPNKQLYHDILTQVLSTLFYLHIFTNYYSGPNSTWHNPQHEICLALEEYCLGSVSAWNEFVVYNHATLYSTRSLLHLARLCWKSHSSALERVQLNTSLPHHTAGRGRLSAEHHAAAVWLLFCKRTTREHKALRCCDSVRAQQPDFFTAAFSVSARNFYAATK